MEFERTATLKGSISEEFLRDSHILKVLAHFKSGCPFLAFISEHFKKSDGLGALGQPGSR